MNFSIVIPCYNFEKKIESNILKLINKLRSININYEIILVNDGSQDNTLKKLNFIKNKNKKINIINNKKNIGKSYSLIKGISATKFENILIYDCDLPYFGYLKKVINLSFRNDLVYINRKSKNSFIKSSSLTFYQMTRFIIGRLVCLFLNILCLNIEVGDTQAGLKFFKKPKNFKKIKFISEKFFFDAEIMIFFFHQKKKMQQVSVKYDVPEDSTIQIFGLKNFLYIFELIKVVFHYKFFSYKKMRF